MTDRLAPIAALAAAMLFGLSAPAAKWLVGAVDPWLLAGLLYVGSGAGLAAYQAARRLTGRASAEAPVSVFNPWLAGATLAGGVVGPVLLMAALARGTAAGVALMLNLEGVFTALVAWLLFREAVGARIAAGMGAIVGGALVLAWDPAAGLMLDTAAALVAGACLAWAVDNNLTRHIAGLDPLRIAALKGAVAGTVNVVLAVAHGAPWPSPGPAVAAVVVGVLGYGTSLALFVVALRHLGTARTGGYFATAPFVGAVAGVLALGEPLTVRLGMAAILMGVGVALHLTERHDHEHVHEPFEHEHLHWHDEHHRHPHGADDPAREPHSHHHAHGYLLHEHPHYPDLHHRHRH